MSNEDLICRYCFDTESNDNLFIYPCDCYTPVHRNCLKEWLKSSRRNECEICDSRYKNVKFISKVHKAQKFANFVSISCSIFLLFFLVCNSNCESKCLNCKNFIPFLVTVQLIAFILYFEICCVCKKKSTDLVIYINDED